MVLVWTLASLSIGAWAGDFEDAKADYEKENYTGALSKFQRVAITGNAEAQFMIGEMYLFHFENNAQAVYWYKLAAEQSHEWAKIRLQELVTEEGNIEALDWLEKFANQGDERMLFILAEIYEQGRGISKNHAKALIYYIKSAEKGNAEAQKRQQNIEAGNGEAQYHLALMYEEGREIQQNNNQFLYWLTQAAERGYAKAQYRIGDLYYLKNSAEYNPEKAVYWLTKAAEQGDYLAQKKLVLIDSSNMASFQYGIASGVEIMSSEGLHWYNKARQQEIDAQKREQQKDNVTFGVILVCSLALLCFIFFHLSKLYANISEIKARRRHEAQIIQEAIQSFNRGDSHLSLGLERLAIQGNVEAIQAIKTFAQQGNAYAQNALGSMYHHGTGLKESPSEAMLWYKKAADQGNTKAQEALRTLTRKTSKKQKKQKTKNIKNKSTRYF